MASKADQNSSHSLSNDSRSSQRAEITAAPRRMGRVRFGAAMVLAVLAGCATATGPTATSPTATRVTATKDWPNFTVVLTMDSYSNRCTLEGAVLTNTGTQSLSYVYTELLIATLSGVTVQAVDINFPPTVGGGAANAGHVGTSQLAALSCDNLQLQLTVR